MTPAQADEDAVLEQTQEGCNMLANNFMQTLTFVLTTKFRPMRHFLTSGGPGTPRSLDKVLKKSGKGAPESRNILVVGD